ncbi:hypothetical protein [Streptosporangium vulgare]|uniref:hypothetical protein n=1 Tax=Streptosporangium vulgare TaxID=46190 RepID=UPI0031D79D5F
MTTAVDLSTRPPEAAGHIGSVRQRAPGRLQPVPGGDLPRVRHRAARRAARRVYRFRQVPLSRADAPPPGRHAALVPVSVSYRTRRDADPVFAGLDTRRWSGPSSNHRGTRRAAPAVRGTPRRAGDQPAHGPRDGARKPPGRRTTLRVSFWNAPLFTPT